MADERFRASLTWVVDFRYDGHPRRWFKALPSTDDAAARMTDELASLHAGLDAAGPLPLAEEPRFPEANQLFLQHLKEHGQRVANLAMASAMGNGQTRDGG